MKRDSVTLSQFIKKEERELKKKIIYLENERLRTVHLLNGLPLFTKRRRTLNKINRKNWPLREHPGSFSQALDWYVFPEEHGLVLLKGSPVKVRNSIPYCTED